MPLRSIDDAFSSELVALSHKQAEREAELVPVLRERRARTTVWLERIAWTERPPLKLGEILSRLNEPMMEANPEGWQVIVRELERVGWQVAGYGPLVTLPDFGPLPVPADARGVTYELARLAHSLADGQDMHGAIGYTKNLVEATAKFVYPTAERNLPRDPKFRPVVAEVGAGFVAQVPAAAPSELKEFLRHLNQAVEQIGALRNATDGTVGHGAPVWAPWLEESYSRLVADVGVAWARFALACASEAPGESRGAGR